ncbi:36291_t:CDS:1, partial [Racocetra persica]
SSSDNEWYLYLDFSTSKVKTESFDSDTDDVIDEENLRAKIRNEKISSLILTVVIIKLGILT